MSETAPHNIKKIYFDMDGVIVDFWDTFYKLFGEVDLSDFDNVWNALRTVEHYYLIPKPIDGAIEMMRDFTEKYGDKCEILTAIPAESKNIKYAEEDKRKWVKKYLGDKIKVNVVLRAHKKDLCKGEEYILIDDYQKNIDEWENNGGMGVLFKNVKQIYELFLPEYYSK